MVFAPMLQLESLDDEVLRHTMRCQPVAEMPTSPIAGTSTDFLTGGVKPLTPVSTELSTSLPNLSAGVAESCHSSSEGGGKCARSSLTDITGKMIALADTPNGERSFNGLLPCERLLVPESCQSTLMDTATVCTELRFPDAGRDGKHVEQLNFLKHAVESSPGLVHFEQKGTNLSLVKKPPPFRPPTELDEELTVSVSANNGRLSAVLENIPLLYLPHTKQLISVKCPNNSPTHQSWNPTASALSSMEKSVIPCEKRDAIPPDQSVVHSSMQNGDAALTEGDIVSMLSNPDVHASIPSASSSSTDLQASFANACNLNAVISVPNSGGSELGSSLRGSILSQDSDISVQSNLTVIPLSDDSQSQGPDEEFEEVNELTRINIDRDSPGNTLHRTNTNGSLSRTDASSFSSISSISTGTEFSTSEASCAGNADLAAAAAKDIVDSEEAGFVEINLSTRNSFERCSSGNSSQDSGIDAAERHQSQHPGAKPKRRGITGFLARSLFSRKAKESPTDSAVLGWRLFGKVPPKQTAPKDPLQISEEFRIQQQQQQQQQQMLPEEGGTLPTSFTFISQSLHLSGGRSKKSDVQTPSTTALILEQRPQGLPCKDPEEELRHRQEYDAMVEAAKKKELKEAKMRKKQLQQQLKHEDALSAAVKLWNAEILPSWDSVRGSKKARDMWWQGIPPSVRGRVWELAIGNELNVTPELFEICLTRAKDRLKIMKEASSDTDSLSSFTESSASRESSVELIKLDVSRTFPQLCIFQRGGPYHELLQGLLGAYACYRPDVGYVQGMSFIAAVLLLNMEVDNAFICFANLLNRPCQVAFFRLDEGLMKSYFETYEEFFEENLPKLYSHFQKQNITPDLYIIDWMFTMYARSLPLDVASRVWDVFCRDGEEFLFRTALGILKLYEATLINMDFIHLAQFLTKLPEKLSGDPLFRCIDTVYMVVDKRNFSQVLVLNRDHNKPDS